MLIIPTYNERDNIAPLVGRIRRAVREEAIFFVDDNSPDGTAEEIRRLQRQDTRLHLMPRPGKLGYGSACRQAMQKVLSENLDDYVIQFDADLSHPPELLPRMIELLRTCQVVVGSRYIAGGGSRNWGFRRRLLSYGANVYARVLTGVPVHDMTSGFVGYQASVLHELDLDSMRSEGYAFLMEMKFNLHRRGARFCEFPITFSERERGRSKFSRKIIAEGMRFPLKALARRVGDRRP
jgi:dolichol-phosphate mannosyltransferase